MLRWLKTVVVSDAEKAQVMRQVGIRKASASEPLLTCRNVMGGIETGVDTELRDGPGGCPSIGQVVSGMKAARSWSAAPARNVGRPVPIVPAVLVCGGREGARQRRNPEALSTSCGIGWRTGS